MQLYPVQIEYGKRGIGVFQKTTKGGKVIMFCVKVENEPIQYSLNDCIGNYCDLKFFSATEAEKISLNQNWQVLAKSGMAD